MKRDIKQKWESWIKNKPSHFYEWAIGYIQRDRPWLLRPEVPYLNDTASLTKEELQEWSKQALLDYFQKLPEHDSSHLFLNRIQTAWRTKEQERRDKNKGIHRKQLLVQRHTQKTAEDIAKHQKISVKAALEQMLNNFDDSFNVLREENANLKKEAKNPPPDHRVKQLEKDLLIVMEELEKLKKYSMSHLERYCALVAEKGAEEPPKLTPEQHDHALSELSKKKGNINELLTKTIGIQARHQKKLGKRIQGVTTSPVTT